MTNVFIDTFLGLSKATLQVLIVTLIGAFMVRRGKVSSEQIKALSSIAVKIFVPCLIISKITSKFRPEEFTIWWVLPLVAVVSISVGLLISYLFFIKELPAKNNMLSLSSIQNGAFIVLPIVKVAFPADFDKLTIYIFLYVLGITPLLWSVGKHLSTYGSQKVASSWKDFLSPPLCANFIALFLVFTGLKDCIPSVLHESIELLGSATVPVVTFILGATLGGLSFSKFPPIQDVLRVIAVKMFIIPIITIAILMLVNIKQLYPLLGIIFVLEAATPPATNTIIQVRNYGGDTQKIGSIMLICYALSMITIPVWVAIWALL